MYPVIPPVARLAAALAILSAPLHAQKNELGSVDFANSGDPSAQADFVQGVLLLHSFEYSDAALAFRRAQQEDPDFALAYWGEAMTHNHPIWAEQDQAAAREVLDRYEGSPSTEREALYLDALGELYGEGSKSDRDRRYMLAMRRLHEAHPEDPEARAFYALAILGLPAARAYGEAVPDAGHAQHMTSHIFLAMGMWDDVIRANINATRVADQDRARRGEIMPNRCGHYPSWLHYGYLMREQWTEATRIMDMCQANQADPDRDDRGYYVRMRARQILDTGVWDGAERWTQDVSDAPPVVAGYTFSTAYAALKRGDPGPAEAALAGWGRTDEAPRLAIMALELRGLLALDRGAEDEAVALLRSAAEIEESLPLEFGPPASPKPPHELLGEILLELGRPAEAVDAFQGSLALTPLRTPSLRGLARAARQAGMDELASDTEHQIQEIVQ